MSRKVGTGKPLVYILTRRAGMAAEGFDFQLSSCGFRVGVMGLHPANRICLNGCGLGTSEARSNYGAERGARFIATHSCDYHPEVSPVHILRYTATAVVERSKLRLGGNVSLFGGASEPPNRLDLVQLHSLSGGVAKA